MATETLPFVPLDSGDRLTREEFHRRYCARPDIRKAELIGGVVYVASPTRAEVHGNQHPDAVFWLRAYALRTPGVQVSIDATVYLGDDSEVQPDVILYRVPAPPGAVRMTDGGYLEGPPQFIFEIAATSASYDLHDKKEVYRRSGVQEYVVWQVYEQRIIWFRLVAGEYVQVEPDERGVIASCVFPGPRLHVAKLLAGDYAGVLAELSSLGRT